MRSSCAKYTGCCARGRFIVTTPNAPMSLTRNPWHVREYTAEQLRRLLAARFSEIETLGVFGNEKVMDYYAENRRGVERITRFDILDLQHRLPRWMLQIPYDILNRMNRRKLLRENTGLTTSIRMDDYRIEPVGRRLFRPVLHRGEINEGGFRKPPSLFSIPASPRGSAPRGASCGRPPARPASRRPPSPSPHGAPRCRTPSRRRARCAGSCGPTPRAGAASG